METRNVKLTLEKAKEFYVKGGELRDLALSAFTEEELTKKELPKTWGEFCRNYPVKNGECIINNSSAINQLPDGGFRSPYSDANNLPSFEAAKAHLALMQLHQLRDCYRQGWVPDWKNDTTAKYCIVNYEHSFITCYATYARFLSFQSKEIAEEFLNNFRDLIEQTGDLI